MATLKDLLVSGPARVIGKINATSFVKNGATANNILLAGGGDVAQSEFASGSHTHTTTIATSTGTSQITLAYETKYSITAGGTSYIFTTPSLGTSATTAAAGNHTHTTSLTSGGTSEISLAANTAYTLTAGGTSVVFKTPADNNNVTTGKSGVVLGTTGVAVVQKDGTDSGTVALPSTIPSTWLGTTATTAAAGDHGHSGYLTSHQTIKVDGVTGATTSHYGTCSTGASTAAKAVSVTGTPALEAGLRVIVKFTTTNTAASPTLNVNSLGAKVIYYRGSAITGSSNNILQANRVYEFVYDGTNWQLVGDINTNSGGTVTSVGLTNATDGGLTVSGSPVTGSGSITVGHTNVLSSAQNTKELYPITFDKNGHITDYGEAINSLSQFINDVGFTTNTGTVTSVGITNGGGLTVSGSPVTGSGSITVGHTNTVTAGTNIGNNSTTTLTHNGTFIVPYFSYDTNGHITAASTKTLTLPDSENTDNYGTVYVETGATTRAKTATVPWTYTLKTGNVFVLYLKTTNTVTTSGSTYVTLNINSTGAKQVRINGAVPTTSNWTAGTYLCYYDGTYYQMYTNRDPFRDTLPPDAGTTASAVGTSSSGGSATTYSKSDHVHNITSATITAALGYTPSSTDTNNTLSGVAICSTAAGTAAKTANIPNFTLVNGQTILLLLKNSNTASSPTLNINSSGAKAVYIGSSAATTSNFTAGYWFCTYDNTQTPVRWTIEKVTNSNISNGAGYTTNTGTVTSVGLSNAANGGLTISDSPVTGSGTITVGHTNVLSSAQTTQAVYPIKIDKNGHISSYGTAVTIPTNTDNYGTINIETAAGTAAKTATVPWSYTLKQGNMFIVYLKNSNTNTAATLSINSTTAKSVLLDDEALTSSSWVAGTYFCFYDGTYYRMYTKNPEWVVKQTAVSSTSAEYPMLFSSTQDPTSGALYETSYTTKTKVSNNGDIILHNSATSGTINSPSLIFRRGGATDSYVDFSIQNASGIFTVSQRSTSAFAARMQLTHTGDLTITGSDSTHGNMTANKFIKANPTNATGILLADGTDIAQSTFAQSTHSHYITDLADVYTDSQRIDEVLAFNGSIWQGMYVAKTVNAGSGLNATSGDTTNDGGYIGWGTSGGGDASVPTGTLHLTRVNTESSYDGSAKPGFGPTTDTTVSSSNNTFTVPYYKVDKFGRVTESANKTITISGLGTGGGGGATVTGKTVTLDTTGAAVLQVNGSDSGSVALPSAPPSTWLGTTETTAAAGSHGHGTITNGGYIRGAAAQAGGTGNNQVAIANGDRIVIADYSGRTSTNYFPLKLTSIVFDGSTTTQFLSKKGTWETPSGGGNISAISPESLIQGYTAGGVVIGQERTEFIVPPARIVESGAASEYNLQRQGVVRPQYEIDATTWEDTLALNSGTRFNIFDMIIVPTIPTNTGINACCFLPITVMYRYNTVTSRYESVPGILISTDISKPFEMYDITTQSMWRQK